MECRLASQGASPAQASRPSSRTPAATWWSSTSPTAETLSAPAGVRPKVDAVTIHVRRTQQSEARSTSTVVSDALLFPRLTDEEWAVRETAWAQTDSISAWDGGRCV